MRRQKKSEFSETKARNRFLIVYLVNISILRPAKPFMIVLCLNISGKRGVFSVFLCELLHIDNRWRRRDCYLLLFSIKVDIVNTNVGTTTLLQVSIDSEAKPNTKD